jgi:hypothetical protein
MWYTGTTADTRNDGSYMNIYKIRNWRSVTYGGQSQFNRIHIHRYCSGYKKTTHGYRNVQQCGNWVKKVDPEARFFFFRHQSNWHCSPCPLYYTGSTAYTAVDRNTRIHIYRITGWKRPTFGW